MVKTSSRPLTSKATDALYERHQDDYVFIALYADPPAPSVYIDEDSVDLGLITYPQGWASDAVDKAIGVADCGYSRKEVVASAWDPEGGLAIVIRMRLSDLAYVTKAYGTTRRPTLASPSSVCAHVEYRSGRRVKTGLRRGEAWCEDCLLQGFQILHGRGGCNPGGSIFVPQAQQFSLLALRTRAQAFSAYDDLQALAAFASAPKLTAQRVAKLFPEQNWGSNHIVETLAENCRLKLT